MLETNSSWTLYAHLNLNVDWTYESYKKLFTYNNVEDIIVSIQYIPLEFLHQYSLFIMRDNIKPIWEDPMHKGQMSYKLTKDALKQWRETCYHMICEDLTENKRDFKNINGMSIFFKGSSYMVKVWVNKKTNLKLLKHRKFIFQTR